MHSTSTSASKYNNSKTVSATRVTVLVLCLLCIGSSSCKKFLEAYSQNESFVETAEDLDEILVGETYFPVESGWPAWPYLMDDDVEEGRPGGRPNVKSKNVGFHFWWANPRVDSEGGIDNTDKVFTTLYFYISRTNTVLHNVSLLRGRGTSATTLNRIAGEAHFLRAYYYFTLANLYGKPYKTATAAADLSIPLKTEAGIKEQFATRNTVREVYNQIVTDLLEAEKLLEGTNAATTIRANQRAAQSLLSRMYLYMEDYEKAVLYADKVINSNAHMLTELNNHIPGNNFINRNSREVIFSMGGTEWPGLMALDYGGFTTYFHVSSDLSTIYQPEDLRLQVFFKLSAQGQLKTAKKYTNVRNIDDASQLFLLRLAEQYLNKAEALAAMDRFADARNTVQELRKKRFRPSELNTITADGAALVNFIRDERRRELCHENHRWFDLRRYGVNAKYPFGKFTRHRSFQLTGNTFTEVGYYELKPYDQEPAAYTIPIANNEIEFNQGRLTNEQRPERSLQQ